MAQPMSVDEREAKEAEEFRTGPLSVLTTSVKTNSQVCAVLAVIPHSFCHSGPEVTQTQLMYLHNQL